jgi:hypothetical protein
MSAASTEFAVAKETQKQKIEKRIITAFDLNMYTPLKKVCGPERSA